MTTANASVTTNNIRSVLKWARAELGHCAGDRALVEARLLLAKVLARTQVDLIANDLEALRLEAINQFETMVVKRKQGMPMAYLLEEKEFYGISFKVGSDVLIPRPETEGLVQCVLSWLTKKGLKRGRIIDLGTGSGCIAISLARHLQGHFVIDAVERSQKALDIAEENYDRYVNEFDIQRLRFHEADFCHDTEEVLHRIFKESSSTDLLPTVIVSNPPYIPAGELKNLPPEILTYEPQEALEGGKDGLDFYRAILEAWVPMLDSPGLLALETNDASQREFLFNHQLLNKRGSSWSESCCFMWEI